MQPDTDVPESQGVQSWNRYSYVNDSPIGHNDPTGHCIEDLCIGETALVIAAGTVIVENAPEIEAAAEEAGPEAEQIISEAGPAIEKEAAQLSESAQPAIKQVVASAQSAVGQVGNQLLRYIHPNNILPDGNLKSLAFRDPAMSVFNESSGATPEMVLDTMSKGSGQGAVYGLNPSAVQNVSGVTSIEPELGNTGNSVLDAAHQVINNVGTKSVARALRDIAQFIIGDNGDIGNNER